MAITHHLEGLHQNHPRRPAFLQTLGMVLPPGAEGGTHEGHRLPRARSRSIWGPYKQCPHNPILKPSSDFAPYQQTQFEKHSDLFQDDRGKWWLVCLASRLDRDGRSAMGREAFLISVS